MGNLGPATDLLQWDSNVQEYADPLSDTPNEIVKFRQRFSLRKPYDGAQNVPAHESEPLDASSGLRLLEYAPAQNVQFGYPPSSRRPDSNQYLWVIDDRGIPFVKEAPIAALGSRLPKHTNLTGGRCAFVGGQLWFENQHRLFVSGGSGRYRPLCPEHLAAAVGVFQAFQYAVTSLGWDSDLNRPFRHLE